MPIFNRRQNQQVRLTAPGQAPTDDAASVDPPTEGVEFTTEQYATLTEALELDPKATPDEVVAAVTALVEGHDDSAVDVIAAAGAQGVRIDAHAWADMKRAVQRGLSIEQQEHRLAAEQVVDQAIRLSKAAPGQREQWISAYEADPEETIKRLSRAKEIPLVELGSSIDPYAGGNLTPPSAGWVRRT